MTPSPALRTASEWVGEHRTEATALSDEILGYAEPGLREYQSAAALERFLGQAGFEIEESPAGMPTAFVATWGSGRPAIGLLCEYDATPGDSQRPVPRPDPIGPDACGFPDLHNGIGAASAAAAVAAQGALAKHGLPGSIRVLGTPAEKLCVGKPYLARDGYFDGLDAIVAWHPRPYTTVEWDHGPGCYQAEVFDFEGRSAYASAPWAGVSALDSLLLMNVIVQFMREHIPRKFLATVNEIITSGGQHPTSLPAYAQAWYVYRSPVREGILHVQDLLGRAAEAACLATGGGSCRRMVASTRPWVPNHALARLCYRNLERAGAPRVSDEMTTFGREMLRVLGLPDDVAPFDETVTPVKQGITAEFAGGADDVTECCWHAPTARIYVAYGLRVGRLPNWAGAALAGTPAAHATVLTAAEAMATSLVDLVLSPEVLEEAAAEFRQRTAGGPGPLVPPEVAPPVDLSFAPYYPAGWRPPGDRDSGE